MRPFAEVWQKIVEKTQSGVDRLTHTRDRRRAVSRVRLRRRPRRVMVVCYGNICRSPYAEAYLRSRLQQAAIPNIEVVSSGFYGPDRTANEQGAALALTRRIDLSNHRSRLFQPVDATQSDLVLVMTRSQRAQLIRQFGVPPDRIELLGDFDPEDPPYREIVDPYGQPDDVFRKVFDQIERSLDGLRSAWAGQGAVHDGSPPAV